MCKPEGRGHVLWGLLLGDSAGPEFSSLDDITWGDGEGGGVRERGLSLCTAAEKLLRATLFTVPQPLLSASSLGSASG